LDRNGRSRKDRNGMERTGWDWKGWEWTGRIGTEGTGSEWIGKDGRGMERLERSGAFVEVDRFFVVQPSSMRRVEMPRSKVEKGTGRSESCKALRGKGGNGRGNPPFEERTVVCIPPLSKCVMRLRLIGDRPLLVNNKMGVAAELAEQYVGIDGTGTKASGVKREKASYDEQYRRAFYQLPCSKYQAPDPKGRYGVPIGGIRKCACSAIATAGITNNKEIGAIKKSFFIKAETGCGGYAEVKFGRLERDVRPAGQKNSPMPRIAHRPMFHDWRIDLTIQYNPKVLTPDQIVNLFMHAGQYIGLCELRAEKLQGECGGFVIEIAE